jgi:hypothetical protein
MDDEELLELTLLQHSGCKCTGILINARCQGCRLNVLRAEVLRLRQQVQGHCDRIASQSELLAKRAEKS